jgi:hypothetical protein
LFTTWSSMRDRCYKTKHVSYHRYGGRGLTICDEWRNCFSAFACWAFKNGYKPGLSIDRIDNSKGYSPDNCRWATRTQQLQNKSCVHPVWREPITLFGESKLLSEWIRDPRINMNYYTVRNRIMSYGFSPEQALLTPVAKRKSENGS